MTDALELIAKIAACIMCIGLGVGFVPLAIVFPAHGHMLVRIQAGGVMVAVAAIFLIVILAAIVALIENLKP